MPVRHLPADPNLDHLKYQAKDLLKERATHTLEVAQRIREFHPRFRRATDAEIFDTELSLSDAQPYNRPRIWISKLGEVEATH